MSLSSARVTSSSTRSSASLPGSASSDSGSSPAGYGVATSSWHAPVPATVRSARASRRSTSCQRTAPALASPPPVPVALGVARQQLHGDRAEIGGAVHGDRLVADRVDVVAHEDAAPDVGVHPVPVGLGLV